jgi:type VI secretion system protein ImpL
MKAFLLSRWLLSFIGVAILAALVWIFGPLLAAFAAVLPRALVIVLLLLLWGGINYLISWRRGRADRQLAEGVTEAVADPSVQASAEEVAALREKLGTALGLLKKARGTRGYLYEQPWYVIIGPPGAGKTTALLNAGLQFPLAAEMGQGAVAGVGGTRLCDWWFTENAVLIDTAGRYTTQDSDAAVDRAGWEGFLDLLKRTRARQPLNGVIVAVSIADIAQAPQGERLAHARAVRRRVKEVTERLGVRVPVYALFTKADLIAGFMEFHDDLDREKRAQVWGTTFPLATGEAGPLGAFPAEFALLVERLNQRLLDRLQAERSPERRAMIAGFPAQVASLEAPLAEFLREAFGGSKLDPAPFLRGVYLTSGTQEGTPIDRLTGLLSRAFGLDQRRAPSLRPEQGRSYFLGRLLKDVVFGEAMLVSRDPAATRRRALLRAGAFALIGLVTLGAAALLWQDRSTNEAAIARSEAALAAYETTAKGLPLDPVNDADLPRIVPLLDQARALPFGYEDQAKGGLGAGLSQAAKLGAAARLVYRNALDRVLLPRLIWRLEVEMRGALDRPDFLYEATRVYLMLGGAGPLDKDLVHAWMQLDWQRLYPGVPATPLREDLLRHLDAMLAGTLPKVPLDGALIEQARAVFSRIPLAQRVYARISQSAAAQRVKPWTPAEALGAGGVRLFLRASGKPLTDGIPGFYTIDGFHKVLLPALANVTQEVAAESWVLGQRAEINPASPELPALERDVIHLYAEDYAKHWTALMADLDVVPMRSLAQASQDLYLLASPQSPMRDLLAGIARQLQLSVPPPPPPGQAAATAAAGAAAGAAAQAAQAAVGSAEARLKGLLGAPAGGAPAEPPGKAVDDQFKPLIDFVGKGPGAPIDAVLKLLNDLQQQLGKLAAAPVGGAPPVATGEDPAQLLVAEASRDPQPVARWLQAIAASGTALRGGGARQQVAAAFNGGGGGAGGGGGVSPAQLCRQAVEGRYPFSPGATAETPLGDFTRLFAPGGLLDGFFNTQLRPFVDMSGPTWRAQKVDGVDPPVSPGALAQFQRAAVIRDIFFAAGAAAPSVQFDITPVSLDPGAKQVTLDLGGTSVVYAHGPVRPTQITWPGPNGMTNVRLTFDPPPSTGTPALNASGPWALFRLFGMGSLAQAGGPELYRLTFRLGDREAVFDIRAGSVFNPFAPGVLQAFRCPGF